MENKELNTDQLVKAQKRANTKAKRIIHALGMDDMVVRNNYVVLIRPDGSEQVVQRAQFKSVKAKKGTYQLKNE